MGEGEAVARARRRQGVVDEEATALGIAGQGMRTNSWTE